LADETLKRDVNYRPVGGAVTDDSAQEIKQVRVDPITGALITSGVGNDVDTVFLYNVLVSNADTTIIQALPSRTRKFKIYAMDWNLQYPHSDVLKYAYAINSSSVVSIPPVGYELIDGVNLIGGTLYFQSPTGSAKVVIYAWT